MVDKKKGPQGNMGDDFLAEFKSFEEHQQENKTSHGSNEPIAVRISDDKLKASVNVAPQEDVQVSKNDIINALKAKGVVFGIQEDAIDEVFSFGSFNVDVAVAKGKKPSDGVAARIEYKFETAEKAKVQMVEDEHGNVDHKSVQNVESMPEGSVVAVKIPAIKGEPGMTVTGETIPAVEGRDVPIPAGEGTHVSEDGLSLISTQGGRPIIKDGKICVSPVYEVKGDVSYATGNISFNGTIVIRGGVQSDFKVTASGDIEVWGNIEKAHIEAEGDVRCRSGLYGQNEGVISAGGSVVIRSVESGMVEAGKNITITQSSRYSTLQAGEDVVLNNAKGSIVGGKITAGRIIDVTNLGSPSFTETMVEVGFNPKIRELQTKVDSRLNEDKQHLDKALHMIKSLKEMQDKGPLAPDKLELMKKLVPAAHQLKASIEEGTAKLNFINEKIRAMQVGRLKVKGVVYPGVRITTVNANMTIRKEIKFSAFYEQNEQIIVGPY